MPYKKLGETISSGVAFAPNFSPIRHGLAIVLMIGLLMSSVFAAGQQSWNVSLDTDLGAATHVTLSLQPGMSSICPNGGVLANLSGSGDVLTICLDACGQMADSAQGDLAIIQTLDAQGTMLQTFLVKVTDGVVIVVLTDD